MAESRSRAVTCLRQGAADGRLPRRFTKKDFTRACPGLGRGTYNAFLWKHREGNPGGYRPYVRLVGPGLFELIPHDEA
jgi:hypothetical protein